MRPWPSPDRGDRGAWTRLHAPDRTYRQPADPQAFDQAYFETHLPLIAKVPGLQKTAVSRFTQMTMGDAFSVKAEMFFPDEVVLEAVMRSPQMGEARANLATFADGLVAIMFAEESKPAG